MRTVCVPTEYERGLLGELPDEFRVVIWDGSEPLPAEVGEIEFLCRRGGARIPDEVLSQLKSLQVLHLLAAGVDPWVGHVPDGVTFCNARGIHGGSTAELALGGMIAVLRGIPQAVADQAAHAWPHPNTDCLDGKRVTVVGAGDIAKRIAAAVEIFGATATLVGRTARDGVRGVDELKELLRETDIVALAVPGTPDTKGLIDAEALAALPDGAMLANVCRGNVVVTDALLAELQAKRLYAFLDVTDPEPLPPEHPLWDAPNLLITSHVGGAAFRWQERCYRLIREQLFNWQAGKPLRNVITGWY